MTPERCTLGALRAGEPLAGTAPRALGWVALEQTGPWGAKALTDSHLPHELGAKLDQACSRHGLRAALIRRPGKHADHRAPRHALVAHTSPGGAWLLEARLTDPAELLALDWQAVADGDQEAAARSLDGARPRDLPALLVCTNGSRDRCCALEGRQVALAAHRHRPELVWETTHLSGHRFAATAVALPSGQVHGRLAPDSAPGLIDAIVHGRTPLATLRGRSTWGPREQVAEIVVREAIGEDSLDAIVQVSPAPEPEGTVLVRHADGRTWTVEVTAGDAASLRAESCGKPDVAMTPLTGRLLTAP